MGFGLIINADDNSLYLDSSVDDKGYTLLDRFDVNSSNPSGSKSYPDWSAFTLVAITTPTNASVGVSASVSGTTVTYDTNPIPSSAHFVDQDLNRIWDTSGAGTVFVYVR